MTAHVVVSDAQAAQVFQSIRATLGAWHNMVSNHGEFSAAGRCAFAVTLEAGRTQALPERCFVEIRHGFVVRAMRRKAATISDLSMWNFSGSRRSMVRRCTALARSFRLFE
nr:hypothetical protein [Acetobacter syzygii]